MSQPTICQELGRCVYDVANGAEDSGCPWWRDCFGPEWLCDVRTNEPVFLLSPLDGEPT